MATADDWTATDTTMRLDYIVADAHCLSCGYSWEAMWEWDTYSDPECPGCGDFSGSVESTALMGRSKAGNWGPRDHGG